MKQSELFKGILPAIITPVDKDEVFAPATYKKLVESVYAAGVHGLYVCGQTGEGLLQSVKQRKLVAEESVKHSPTGKHVIVHVGAYSTRDAVELSSHASSIGVSAISSLPPLGPYSFPEIKAYYEAVASASKVPLLVYYFPETFPAIKTAEQILELCTIPNVIGLKFTDFDLYRMRLLKNNGAVIFNGRDEVLTAGLLMGADGGIGSFYNIIPELFVEVYSCTQKGNWPAALIAQDRINAIIQLTLNFPMMAALKQILQWMGIDCGRCIAPRQVLSAAQSAELRKQLEAIQFQFDRTA